MRARSGRSWTAILGLLIACTQPRFVADERDGGTADSSQPATAHPDGWVARPDWPGQLRRISPERDLNARVVRVVPDPARAQFWVLSYAEVAPGAAPRFALRRYDRDGKPTWSSINSEPFRAGVDALGATIGDIALHDDGSLSVLVLTPVEAYEPNYGAWSRLSFMRIDAEGNLLREAKLEAPPETQHLAWCEQAGERWACRPERADDEPNNGWWLAFLRQKGASFPLGNRLLADGDDLLLLRTARGHRLQRLDAEYRVTADAIVLPSDVDMRGVDVRSAAWLTRDARGRVIVLHAVDEVLLSMLAAADGPALSLGALIGEESARDEGILLQYFDAGSLQRVAVHLLAAPEKMRPAALVADGDEVVAVLNYEPAGRALSKGDVVLMRARVTGANPRYQRFGLPYRDSATDAVMLDGHVWLSGITNDEHLGEDVIGLVTSVDREGDVGPVLRLAGPRNVQADVIAADGVGGLMIGGVENVPDLVGCSQSAPKCASRAFVATMREPRPSPLLRADLAPLPSATWQATPAAAP